MALYSNPLAYAEAISANLLEQHGDTVKLVIGKKRSVYACLRQAGSG
jgi:hypothetical protein